LAWPCENCTTQTLAVKLAQSRGTLDEKPDRLKNAEVAYDKDNMRSAEKWRSQCRFEADLARSFPEILYKMTESKSCGMSLTGPTLNVLGARPGPSGLSAEHMSGVKIIDDRISTISSYRDQIR